VPAPGFVVFEVFQGAGLAPGNAMALRQSPWPSMDAFILLIRPPIDAAFLSAILWGQAILQDRLGGIDGRLLRFGSDAADVGL
jgi:hypothetical protein